MGKPKAPTPPDPKETAAASTSTNIGSAIANTTMGNMNQYGPTGSLEYSESGTQDWTDPYTGKTYALPQWSATTSLSPEEQAIFNADQQSRLGMGELAAQQTGFLKDYMSEAPNFDTGAVEGRLFDLANERLAPMFEKDRAAMEQRLATQGLQPGSEAWQAEMSQFNQGKNDAYNQLALQGRGQAMGELMAMRNQPINEITALLSGGQVSMPGFAANNPSRAATTDVGGLINQNYQQKQQNYQQQMAQQQSLLGGLFGLGAAGIKASDRRLKKNIRKVGKRGGFNVYEYNYTWQPEGAPMHKGFMAQEVIKTMPKAVKRFGKFMALDYGMLPEVS